MPSNPASVLPSQFVSLLALDGHEAMELVDKDIPVRIHWPEWNGSVGPKVSFYTVPKVFFSQSVSIVLSMIYDFLRVFTTVYFRFQPSSQIDAGAHTLLHFPPISILFPYHVTNNFQVLIQF